MALACQRQGPPVHLLCAGDQDPILHHAGLSIEACATSLGPPLKAEGCHRTWGTSRMSAGTSTIHSPWLMTVVNSSRGIFSCLRSLGSSASSPACIRACMSGLSDLLYARTRAWFMSAQQPHLCSCNSFCALDHLWEPGAVGEQPDEVISLSGSGIHCGQHVLGLLCHLRMPRMDQLHRCAS